MGLSLTERFDYPDDEVGHGTLVSAGAFVRCDSTHHCISIFALKGDAGALPEASRHGLHHIAFEMRTPEELIAKYHEFRKSGVAIVSARRGGPGNQPRFYVHDLDQNLLEFYWGIDEIGWQGTPRQYPDIEEIALEEFDFDAFVAERERAADRSGSGQDTVSLIITGAGGHLGRLTANLLLERGDLTGPNPSRPRSPAVSGSC